jgi:predicted nuclease with TOPRIM domain
VNPAMFQNPFVQTALPIMFTILIAAWVNNKAFDVTNRRFDDMNHRFDETNRRFDEVIKRLDRIETKLDDHGNRIVRLEGRTSPLVRS